MELLEFSFIAGGNKKNSIATLKNSSAVFYKVVSIHLLYNPTISTPRYLTKRYENTCAYKDLYVYVHRSFIHSSPKLETQISIT